ncbi:PRC-barrel domain-containing protein [Brevundimonas sp.]|uniref:PRC-barrel domain-containing protein n=1 Tax=Brevundimonas sp. TaxID=1871086 RepID=UPI002D2AC237|nr:PRC-barrel domain-containing protein [Brevundimonas sp.]HYC97181.1 PRC-barrel domain-containing protein [Brevundimonas sp.]
MTLESRHHLIMSSRVTGTTVFNRAGERIGHVEDLSIHKVSGQVIYAVMSFGGFLGIAERFHPVPWSMLEYDVEKNGYVVALDKAALEAAPTLDRAQLETLGAGDAWRTRLFDYYGTYGALPYI